MYSVVQTPDHMLEDEDGVFVHAGKTIHLVTADWIILHMILGDD